MSQEQQIRQMVWGGGRGEGNFQNARCKEHAGSSKAEYCTFVFFRPYPAGMTRAGQILLLQRHSYVNSDKTCRLAQRVFPGIFPVFHKQY